MSLTDPSKLPNFIAWVEALESGDFDQARGTLREKVDGEVIGYCCLGVATDLAVRAGVTSTLLADDEWDCASLDDPEHRHNQWCAARGTEILAPEVAEWLGLAADERNPELFWLDGGAAGEASVVNDRGTSFADIAMMLRYKYLDSEAPQDK